MSSDNMSNPTYNIHTPGGGNVSHLAPPGGGGAGLGGDGEEGYSVAEKAVIGTMLTIMVFVAVVGNLLVCAAVFTDRRLKRNSNFFIVSLAIADLLVALVVMTFAIANDIHGRWVFGAVFCRIWISSDIMCSTASILNLCVISLDRYVHIKDPLRYEAWMTTRKTVIFIGTVWVLSALMSFVPTHLGWHESPAGLNSTADTELCIFDLNPIYAVVSSAISFYIPCIVMVSIYVRLYCYARRHAETIRRTHTAERFGNGAAKGSYKVSDHKAAVTLGIIMGVFLLCWAPFFVINPIAAFCNTCIPKLVFQILTWCGYVNSCLNPIIYSIFNTEFRYAFRRILFPKCFLEARRNQYSPNNSSAVANRSRVNKTEYGPPLTENGASTVRRNSKEKLFADKVTSL
ncbi:dopamine receptor 1-like [Littorina saxatilis]|uniref:G-protein coupled receptors family 1 profile domain-containing protein n=1 Tax=Littorina saxatilis TaxID=31220 RepID=A0AAN9GJK3_9CAEN